MLTIRDLIVEHGHEYGKWMQLVVDKVNATGMDVEQAIQQVMALPQFSRRPLRDLPLPFYVNLDVPSEDPGGFHAVNRAKVLEVMGHIMRVPTIVKGAIMPDACPAGTICVGGVVAAKNAIHPAFHSADICCSVMLSEFDDVDPLTVLDASQSVTHFGPTARPGPQEMPQCLIDDIMSNDLTRNLLHAAKRDFATQGDGNHFLFVGRSKNTGKTCVVTHHGSRSFGAKLYKKGMTIAKKFACDIAPEEIAGNAQLSNGYRAGDLAWIPFDTPEGQEYWDALEIIERWTHENHYRIHSLIGDAIGRSIGQNFWNPHNFVFRKGDLFYHAKGATPGFKSYDRTLVPLNMAEPILVTRGTGVENGIGFLPHGAGRNMSRTAFQKAFPDPSLPEGIDVRSFSGVVDTSELPQAYKNAAEVKQQMVNTYGLANVVDEIEPFGSIMAGHIEPVWKKGRK